MMPSIFASLDLALTEDPSHVAPYILSAMLLFYYMPLFHFYLVNKGKGSAKKMAMGLSKSSRMSLVTGGPFIIIYLFISLIMMNMMGLFPYTIPITSHLCHTLSLGGTTWTTMMMMSMTNIKLSKSLLLPENTPLNMSQFMSGVESISSLIRPITLSFRLSANLSAGHVILAMVTMKTSVSMMTMALACIALILTVMSYLAFETFVGGIQAYVFSLLTYMYSTDYVASKSI